MSDKTTIKIMITVQWNDDTYSQTRIMSDAVTGIEIVEAKFARHPMTDIIVQASFKAVLDEWVGKELP